MTQPVCDVQSMAVVPTCFYCYSCHVVPYDTTCLWCAKYGCVSHLFYCYSCHVVPYDTQPVCDVLRMAVVPVGIYFVACLSTSSTLMGALYSLTWSACSKVRLLHRLAFLVPYCSAAS